MEIVTLELLYIFNSLSNGSRGSFQHYKYKVIKVLRWKNGRILKLHAALAVIGRTAVSPTHIDFHFLAGNLQSLPSPTMFGPFKPTSPLSGGLLW